MNSSSFGLNNYVPDSLYAPLGPDKLNFCKNTIETVYGTVRAPERANGIKCPFGTIDSSSKGIFFRENINTETTWGRVPQLTPRPLNKIGLEWRN